MFAKKNRTHNFKLYPSYAYLQKLANVGSKSPIFEIGLQFCAHNFKLVPYGGRGLKVLYHFAPLGFGWSSEAWV